MTCPWTTLEIVAQLNPFYDSIAQWNKCCLISILSVESYSDYSHLHPFETLSFLGLSTPLKIKPDQPNKQKTLVLNN